MPMDVVDCEIYGEDMQYVEVELDPGEAAIGVAGAMMYMDPDISMDTIFGDGSAQQSGLIGKLMGAGKRLLTGESLFTTVFQNQGSAKRRVAFAARYPGRIVPMDLKELGGTLICQKEAFLCAAKGVSLGIYTGLLRFARNDGEVNKSLTSAADNFSHRSPSSLAQP